MTANVCITLIPYYLHPVKCRFIDCYTRQVVPTTPNPSLLFALPGVQQLALLCVPCVHRIMFHGSFALCTMCTQNHVSQQLCFAYHVYTDHRETNLQAKLSWIVLHVNHELVQAAGYVISIYLSYLNGCKVLFNKPSNKTKRNKTSTMLLHLSERL